MLKGRERPGGGGMVGVATRRALAMTVVVLVAVSMLSSTIIAAAGSHNARLLGKAIVARHVLIGLLEAVDGNAPEPLLEKAMKLARIDPRSLSGEMLEKYVEEASKLVGELRKYVKPSATVDEKFVRALEASIESKLRLLASHRIVPRSMLDMFRGLAGKARDIHMLLAALKPVEARLAALAAHYAVNTSARVLDVLTATGGLKAAEKAIRKAYVILLHVALRLKHLNVSSSILEELEKAVKTLNNTLDIIVAVKTSLLNNTLAPVKEKLVEAVREEANKLRKLLKEANVSKGFSVAVEKALKQAEKLLEGNATIGELVAILARLRALEHMILVHMGVKPIPMGVMLEIVRAKMLAKYALKLAEKTSDKQLKEDAEKLLELAKYAEELAESGNRTKLLKVVKELRKLMAKVSHEVLGVGGVRHGWAGVEFELERIIGFTKILAHKTLEMVEHGKVNKNVASKVKRLVLNSLRLLDEAERALEKGDVWRARILVSKALAMLIEAWKYLNARIIVPLIKMVEKQLGVKLHGNMSNIISVLEERLGLSAPACSYRVVSQLKQILLQLVHGEINASWAVKEVKDLNITKCSGEFKEFVKTFEEFIEKYGDRLVGLHGKPLMMLMRALSIAPRCPTLSVKIVEAVEEILELG